MCVPALSSLFRAEPWAAGTARIASTAYCILYKLCTMQVTRNQMRVLLNHKDSPYIRCLGFLHLRYTCPPPDMFGWYETYLDDLEEFTAGADGVSVTYVRRPYSPSVIASRPQWAQCPSRSLLLSLL